MYIDWIRIYQRGEESETFVCPSVSDPIEPENPQGMEEVMGDGLQVTGQKVLHNGQLLIRHGEKIYDIMGKEVMVNSNGNR